MAISDRTAPATDYEELSDRLHVHGLGIAYLRLRFVGCSTDAQRRELDELAAAACRELGAWPRIADAEEPGRG